MNKEKAVWIAEYKKRQQALEVKASGKKDVDLVGESTRLDLQTIEDFANILEKCKSGMTPESLVEFHLSWYRSKILDLDRMSRGWKSCEVEVAYLKHRIDKLTKENLRLKAVVYN